jgi:hypothetical protein
MRNEDGVDEAKDGQEDYFGSVANEQREETSHSHRGSGKEVVFIYLGAIPVSLRRALKRQRDAYRQKHEDDPQQSWGRRAALLTNSCSALIPYPYSSNFYRLQLTHVGGEV